jgi:tRNA pseudouridine13 synthase
LAVNTLEILELPFITNNYRGIGGIIKEKNQNFIVEEIPVYEPVGEGQHLFLNITREGLTTRSIVIELAKLIGVKQSNIGYAGLKDKHSKATQTFSVLIGDKSENYINELSKKIRCELPVELNWAKPHRKKLRVGHLLGNRFSIKITGIEISIENALDRAKKIAIKLKESGVPNYYGPQRLGKDGKNLRRGLEIIQGKRYFQRGWLRRYLISCYLSHLCNLYLTKRVETGNFNRILKGDIAKKYSTGGMFTVEDIAREQERYLNQEISFTAPIFGPKMWKATDISGDIEEEIWNHAKISYEQLRRLKVRGTRRLGRLIPIIEFSREKDGIVVNFALPKGAYATTVLREIMKTDIKIPDLLNKNKLN